MRSHGMLGRGVRNIAEDGKMSEWPAFRGFHLQQRVKSNMTFNRICDSPYAYTFVWCTKYVDLCPFTASTNDTSKTL